MSIKVSWQANNEVDVVSYEVQRVDNLIGALWAAVATVSSVRSGANYNPVTYTFFFVDVAGDSTKFYRLIAIDSVGQRSTPSSPFRPGFVAAVVASSSGGQTSITVQPASPLSETYVPNAHIELNNFVNQVRSFLRDYPELNRLVAGVENSNRQIVWAISDTLDDFNTTPHFTSFGLTNFPSKSLLVRGVTCALLESVGLLQTRNHLQFSDGGLQVGINDQTQFIQSWIQLFRNSYEEKKTRLKVAINIESAWGGGVSSEYRFINNFYGEW